MPAFMRLCPSTVLGQSTARLIALLLCCALSVICRMAPTCEWDIAAADIIVREAGGVVLQAGLCDSHGRALEKV